jgi:hypothetical protein
MAKIKLAIVAILIIALAGYSYFLNRTLRSVEEKYAADAIEVNRKLSVLHEERLKAQDEAAAQRQELEKLRAEAESLKAGTAKVAAVRQAAPVAAQQAPVVYDARSQAQMAREFAARQKADKLKAEVESLMDQSGKIKNVWEEREARL